LGKQVFPAVFGWGVEAAPGHVRISIRTAKRKRKELFGSTAAGGVKKAGGGALGLVRLG